MPTPFLPYQRDPIAGNLTTPDSWYQFFVGLRQFLESTGIDTGIIDQILARLDELEENQIGAFTIQGLVSVDVFGTPESGVVQVQLENDVNAPGNNYYYGTSDTGVKGWFNSASNLKIASLTGATYTNVQDFVNTMHSPGVITGGEITDIGSGNVRILAGTGMIRVADDDVSSLPFFNFAQTDFAVPNDQLTRFFGVVYNAGSPVVEMRTVYDWNKDTEIPLGSAVRLSTTITNVTPNKYRMGDPITNVIQRFDASSPAIRDNSIGGLLLGETGTRNVTLTAGKIWSRLSDFDSVAKNSSTAPMLSVFFNGVNLTVSSGVTQWDNMNYNTGGALAVLGNNKWANLWFFISIDGTKYGYAYGTGEHNSLGAAANEGLPFYLNQNFFNQTLLLGRFVFQKGAATAGLIESAFTSIFNTSAVNNHNDLAGLQGGAVGEYYHLTAAEHADAVALSAGGTTAQFWRGDQVYHNVLTGPFQATNVTAASGSLNQSGTVVVNVPLLSITGTLQNANTTQQNLTSYQPMGAPQGATLGNMFGLLFLPQLTNSATAVTSMEVLFARCDSSASFTGSVTTMNIVRVADTAGAAPFSATNIRGILVDDLTRYTTTSRAVDLRNSAGTGKFNIFAQGTAPNHFRGNVGVNTTAQFGSGDGVIGIGNAVTLPTVNPTAGVVIYAEGGAAKCRGSGGTISTFGPSAPHCTTCGSDFVHEWENNVRGYGYLAVCMNCYADGVKSFTRVKGSWPEPDA